MMSLCAQQAAHVPLLRCNQLEVGYGGKALLPAIDFTLGEGQLCAVVGRNGAGKTTWFRTLLGLLPPISGRIEHRVSPLPMGYVAQRIELQPILPLCVRDVVAMGLERGRSFVRPFISREERRRIQQALQQMDVMQLASLPFGELSEGQKQRVLMARLLVGRPRLAVLDEPTAAMDMVAERETLELISKLCREQGLAALIVSHQMPAVTDIADLMVFVDRASQTIVQGPPSTVVTHPAFRAQYGTTSYAL